MMQRRKQIQKRRSDTSTESLGVKEVKRRLTEGTGVTFRARQPLRHGEEENPRHRHRTRATTHTHTRKPLRYRQHEQVDLLKKTRIALETKHRNLQKQRSRLIKNQHRIKNQNLKKALKGVETTIRCVQDELRTLHKIPKSVELETSDEDEPPGWETTGADEKDESKRLELARERFVNHRFYGGVQKVLEFIKLDMEKYRLADYRNNDTKKREYKTKLWRSLRMLFQSMQTVDPVFDSLWAEREWLEEVVDIALPNPLKILNKTDMIIMIEENTDWGSEHLNQLAQHTNKHIRVELAWVALLELESDEESEQ